MLTSPRSSNTLVSSRRLSGTEPVGIFLCRSPYDHTPRSNRQYAGDAISAIVVHVCQTGDSGVQFNPIPTCDLSDFTPRKYYGAYYLETDYTENYVVIIRDFLAQNG